MKAIILAGGLGTRISEETSDKPKPMVDISGKPMLWHIMNIFARQGVMEFVIATGYKSEVIESWIKTVSEPWKIQALDTGLNTQTGGRIRECMNSLKVNSVKLSAWATSTSSLTIFPITDCSVPAVPRSDSS
jgi:glucose-1-phosphate cytidylyltransferase